MRLSRIEFMFVNNPARRLLQKYVEFRTFEDHLKKRNIDLAGKVILDVGCGSGYSSELIMQRYRPSQLIGIDFMPEQIELARKRKLNATFLEGDVTKMDFHSNTFDAAFVFGVLHHVSAWRQAIHEISRVLKPRGVLLVEEPRGDFVAPFGRLRFVHPSGARFCWPDFESELKNAGFKLVAQRGWLRERLKSLLCQKQCELWGM